MTIQDLPVGSAPEALMPPHFPAAFQAVIWRNWHLVEPERLAGILRCGVNDILHHAALLGLTPDNTVDYEIWRTRGFLTLIRRNWHLLHYGQLLDLLGWTPEKLAYVLKEDDFFWIKMGECKPVCEEVVWRELTLPELRRSAEIAEIVRRETAALPQSGSRPFDFFPDRPESHAQLMPVEDLRLIHSYSSLFGDPLLNHPEELLCPDEELARYQACGINGIWLHALLYSLLPWTGEASWSDGWQKRLAALQNLTVRAAAYGIKIYLYMNEPRAMPERFFHTHPSWRGAVGKVANNIALCPSEKGMLDSFSNAIERLSREVPLLGGIISINMSENLTHCQSHAPEGIVKPCCRCADKPTYELVKRVLLAIHSGLHRAGNKAQLIAWNWGWSEDWDEKLLAELPEDIMLMLVSETRQKTNAGGIEGYVLDYSISQVGPGPTAKRLLSVVSRSGRKTLVKMQVNNSWELAAVPYLPVPTLIEKHLRNLREFHVENFMFSWSHGGFPGGNLKMASYAARDLAIRDYGTAAAPMILAAWEKFEEAFREFPFHSVDAIYYAPQHYGPANLLYGQKTNFEATMLGFPYDDVDKWHGGHYPDAVFMTQFQKLSDNWNDGVKLWQAAEKLIDSGSRPQWLEVYHLSRAAAIHWRSTFLQIKNAILIKSGNAVPCDLYQEEADLARNLLKLQRQDARIGFESSNHYFYTANDLLEKIINCEYLCSNLKKQ